MSSVDPRRASPMSTTSRRRYRHLIGGAMAESMSGRWAEVTLADGTTAGICEADTAEVSAAVAAAIDARSEWAALAPQRRGQVLFEVAEALDGHRSHLVEELCLGGTDREAAEAEVAETIDCWTHWAGWADKLAAVFGGASAVAGSFLASTTPRPIGVVSVVACARRPLFASAALVAPVVVSGNAAVVLVDGFAPCGPLAVGEILAANDLAAGVINLLHGPAPTLSLALADRVDAIALPEVAIGLDLVGELAERASRRFVRVVRLSDARDPRGAAEFVEFSTVWHPARV